MIAIDFPRINPKIFRVTWPIRGFSLRSRWSHAGLVSPTFSGKYLVCLICNTPNLGRCKAAARVNKPKLGFYFPHLRKTENTPLRDVSPDQSCPPNSIPLFSGFCCTISNFTVKLPEAAVKKTIRGQPKKNLQ